MSVTHSIRKTMSHAALTAVLATAAVGTAVPAAGAASSDKVREVCAKSVYVKKQPGVHMIGTVVKGQKVTVIRYSSSGTFARIAARTPGGPVRGWVLTRYLCS